MIMNYHKFNQDVTSIAAAVPDVLSLMKQLNTVSEILYPTTSWQVPLYTNLRYYQKIFAFAWHELLVYLKAIYSPILCHSIIYRDSGHFLLNS